ncbi:DUF2573 family protein [Paenibacillus koleovorans]|uniref:DUF2573 family protein n=1 Tax=Paenibacillus koleovorans TaxID=121608 RepID=UPI000FD72164|nr:DUF2573 family protein [Paenibacillus koleovorans]
MNPVFDQEFDALVEKFAELVTGKSNTEMVDKIIKWSIYNHIHKSMPALTAHWGQTHPEAKREVRLLFEEIRDLNQAQRAHAQTSGATGAPKEEE